MLFIKDLSCLKFNHRRRRFRVLFLPLVSLLRCFFCLVYSLRLPFLSLFFVSFFGWHIRSTSDFRCFELFWCHT